MPCFHKFCNHPSHLPDPYSLLPNWKVKSLIIGTFNPPALWVPNNPAAYFYGRSRYFWRVLPRFFQPAEPDPAIPNANVNRQLQFLTEYQIGLTDLLISIDDADIENPHHIQAIGGFQDAAIEGFAEFTWNTTRIIEYIEQRRIQCVFFTRRGSPDIGAPNLNTFEAQMRLIELHCNNNGITNHRLHTPTGQGLRTGRPRVNKLTHRWFFEGAVDFPFRLADFQLTDYPWVEP